MGDRLSRGEHTHTSTLLLTHTLLTWYSDKIMYGATDLTVLLLYPLVPV